MASAPTRPSSAEPAYARAAASHDSAKSAPPPKSSFFSSSSSSPTRSPFTSRTTLTTTSTPDLSLDDVPPTKFSLPPIVPPPQQRRSVAAKLTATLRLSITNPFRTESSTSLSRRSSTNSTSAADFSPEMLRLSLAITTRKDSLINSLLSLDGDFVVRIRFLDTVEKFLAEQDNAKQKQMGSKIVNIFFPSIGTGANNSNSAPEVADASWFGLSTCVQDHTLKKLSQGQYYPHMIDARNQVLEGMSHSPLVVDVVERTLNSVPKRSNTPLSTVEPDHE